jgi:hypothetical protein
MYGPEYYDGGSFNGRNYAPGHYNRKDWDHRAYLELSPPPGRSPYNLYNQPRPQRHPRNNDQRAIMHPPNQNDIPAPNLPTVRIGEAVVRDWQRDLGTVLSNLEPVIEAATNNDIEDRAERASDIAEELQKAIGEGKKKG